MQVILRQDVEKVGLRGEVVEVAAGFARNYLLPRRLAEAAAPGRVAELEKLVASRAQHEAQSFEQAQELVQKLEGNELRFDVQAGETGTLFGSVTATDIADRIWESQRVRIDRRKLDLPESIKRIGRYEVPVELFADVTATLRLAVVPEGGELPPEEELQVLDQVAAEEEAAAAAEAEEARAAAEAATEAAVAEAEAEAEASSRRTSLPLRTHRASRAASRPPKPKPRPTRASSCGAAVLVRRVPGKPSPCAST